MTPSRYEKLSRREREIMDLVYRAGSATAGEVRKGLADPPSYSAVRATLRILEEKGHLNHRRDGRRYVFSPTLSPKTVRRSALSKLVKTFFEDSPEQAMAALLDLKGKNLDADELARIAEMIDRAREEGR